MAEDHIGSIFRITSFGESHGKAVGVIIEGCPPLLDLDLDFIQSELNRRKPGQSKFTTARDENDVVSVFSGINKEGKTLGSPITFVIYNKDAKEIDYGEMKNLFRPSHADYTYEEKYGVRFVEGGGRSSARITAGWVAAGSLAKIILKKYLNVEIVAYTKQIKDICSKIEDPLNINLEDVEKSPVRCPDEKASNEMEELILKTKAEGDSLGGVVECIIKNVPAGLGEPVFGKLQADLAKACMNIPATKGFEIGEGFNSIHYYGSEFNDLFIMENEKVATKTNHSGGIQGGVSNGMPIVFRLAFKPTATIFKEQETLSKNKEKATLKPKGRHDACVLPRAVPIVEALAALTLCDHFLRSKTLLR